MPRRMIWILSLLVCSFLFTVPAGAANLPQCAPFADTSEFVLIAEDNVIFEPQTQTSPPREINGNVLVVNPTVKSLGSSTGTGFAKVGANTIINGTLIANTILLPDAGADIDHCIANTFVANTAAAKASCKSGFHPGTNTNFTDYATAHPSCVEPPLGTLTFSSLCGDTPVSNPCPDLPLTVKKGETLTMPPAPPPFAPDTTCFGALTLEPGAELKLTGTFTFNSVKMQAGSKLSGPDPLNHATVNVNGTFIADAGTTTIQNIDLNVAFKTTAEAVQIFNHVTLSSVNINSPFAKCHLHTDSLLTECSEACCKVLDIEPIRASCNEQFVCKCDPGFHFADNTSRICVRD